MNPKAIATQIIESSTYLSLGTTDGKEPWVNAVFFASDEDLNLYFTSYNDSVHCQNILKNPHVAVAIFDSHIIPGSGRAQGVQIKGMCQRVRGDELLQAIEVVYKKRFPDPKERATRDLSIEHFSRPDSFGRTDHIYKIILEKMYILDKTPGKKDTRFEVSL
jgi:uncharacterized protein YhbP (UPF0306 family)